MQRKFMRSDRPCGGQIDQMDENLVLPPHAVETQTLEISTPGRPKNRGRLNQ